jgi:transcriptional regulator with XRE-family HTH domain
MPEKANKTFLDGWMRQHGVTSIAMAETCQTTRQSVQIWRQGKRRIGVEYARRISEAYEIPLHMLRPDVWDDPAKAEGEIHAARGQSPLSCAVRDGGGRSRKGPAPVPGSTAANA